MVGVHVRQYFCGNATGGIAVWLSYSCIEVRWPRLQNIGRAASEGDVVNCLEYLCIARLFLYLREFAAGPARFQLVSYDVF